MKKPPDSPQSEPSESEPSQADRETDALAEHFFSQPPQAFEPDTDTDAWRPAPLNKNERLAMLATVAPVAIGAAVALGLFVFSDPLFASAEADGTSAGKLAKAAAAEADVAAAESQRAELDATRHGLTALAKVTTLQEAESHAAPPPAPALEPAPAPAPVPAPVAAAPPAAPPVAVAQKPADLSTPRPAAVAKPAAGTTRATGAGSVLKRARRALDAGNAVEARMLATQAIGDNPSAAAAYIVLAGALDALGDRPGMQATFRSCAERATDALASACRSLSR